MTEIEKQTMRIAFMLVMVVVLIAISAISIEHKLDKIEKRIEQQQARGR